VPPGVGPLRRLGDGRRIVSEVRSSYGGRSQAYAQETLLFPFRLVWVLLIGVPVALLLFTLSALFFVTVVGIPVAIVLAVLATKALSAPF
jgi:uncharacterized membrane protein YccF (DUF307 family)